MRVALLLLLLALDTAAPSAAQPIPLQGRVTAQGCPASDWVAALLPQPAPRLPKGVEGVRAGGDGRFSIAAADAGRCFLCLYLDGTLDPESVLPLNLERGVRYSEIALEPAAPRARVEAALQTADDKPLGRKSRVHLFDTYGVVAARTPDADGVVTFGRLPAGRYDLWVESPGGGARFSPGDPPGRLFTGLVVTPGDAAQRLELKLPAAGAAQGRLILPHGEGPARGYTVAVQSATTPEKPGAADAAVEYARGAHECYAEAEVGADGSFALSGLTPGEHLLDVRRPGEAAPWCTLGPVKVVAGQTADLGEVAVARNGWQRLFDGKTLAGWKEADFVGRGEVRVDGGRLVLSLGNDMTGVARAADDLPRTNYEVTLDAARLDGGDFFCGITFPVGPDPCSLILGGWGGSVVGLSSVDGMDASENETSQVADFEERRWYRVRLRVTPAKIEAWLDARKIVDLPLAERRISIRIEMEECVPFGLATWRTTGAGRDLRLRRLDGD